MNRYLIPIVALLMVTCSLSPRPEVDLIIHGGKIWTADPQQEWAEAVAIQGDRILRVGSAKDILKMRTSTTRLIDVGEGLVVPGLFDAHLHFLDGGLQLASIDLRPAKTPEAFTRMLADYVSGLEPSAWVTGGNWDHTLWGGDLPDREWIDAVSPNNPVWVSRLDGHMALANTAAFNAAGVNADVAEVDGGTIVRDESGRLTGILKDNAMWLVERAVPAVDTAQLDHAMQAAMKYVNAQGVTSIQHMGTWEDLAVFRRAHSRDSMSVRISAAVPLASWQKLADEIQAKGRGDEWLRIGSLKGFSDGSLGSHTALFLEPYSDQPDDQGLQVNTREDLFKWVRCGDSLGLQVVIHAIGDSANRMILDIYEETALKNGKRDSRHRIEHAQHLHPTDIPRFAALGVIPSMQPYHCIDDGRWAEPLIGPERCRTTYAFRDLIDSGARPAFGSDWYVAPPTPLEGIYAAVTRRTLDDANPQGWYPTQKITVQEALRGYTIDAARASFMEDDCGSLEAGKLADLVVLDRDLFSIDPTTIRETTILMTLIGGEIVHQEPNWLQVESP